MKTNLPNEKRSPIGGRVPLVLLWLLGVPIPVLIIILLLRGCSS